MIFHSYVSLPEGNVVKTQIKTIHKITMFMGAIKKNSQMGALWLCFNHIIVFFWKPLGHLEDHPTTG